jgi:hypothetical protein
LHDGNTLDWDAHARKTVALFPRCVLLPLSMAAAALI